MVIRHSDGRKDRGLEYEGEYGDDVMSAWFEDFAEDEDRDIDDYVEEELDDIEWDEDEGIPDYPHIIEAEDEDEEAPYDVVEEIIHRIERRLEGEKDML